MAAEFLRDERDFFFILFHSKREMKRTKTKREVPRILEHSTLNTDFWFGNGT